MFDHDKTTALILHAFLMNAQKQNRKISKFHLGNVRFGFFLLRIERRDLHRNSQDLIRFHEQDQIQNPRYEFGKFQVVFCNEMMEIVLLRDKTLDLDRDRCGITRRSMTTMAEFEVKSNEREWGKRGVCSLRVYSDLELE